MRILHLEDNPADIELVRSLLVEEWPTIEVQSVSTLADFTARIQAGDWDLVLADYTLADFDGEAALKIMGNLAPEVPFVFVSGTIGEDRAIDAVQGGARDYVLKNRIKRLVPTVRRILREVQESRQRRVAEASQRRLAAVLESTPDFVGMATTDGRIFYINQAGIRMMGYPDTLDFGLLTVRDLHPPEVTDRLLRQIMPTAIRDGTWSGETLLRAQDGRLIPVSQVVIAHQTPAGQLEFVSTVMRDLTGRKITEDALRRSEENFREQAELLDKAREAILVTDLTGRIVFWNQGAQAVYGWTPAEAVGHPIRELFGLDILVEPAVDRPPNREWRGELKLRNKNGDLIQIELSVTDVRDDAGKPKSRLGIGTDITAKKSLEEQLFRVQRLESIGMLAAGIAHDLNNVLAPILMVAPMLRDHVSDPADLRMIETLEKSAERGAGLVRQILGFAQGIGGEPRLVQVKHIIHDIGAFIAATFPKSIRYEEQLAASLWPVRANPTQIHQVLLNLCVNARDALPHGGLLRISADNCVLDEIAAGSIEGARAGAWLRLHVEDGGVGIPAELLARVWDPFFTTKEPGKGTGLGLSTVRGIVERHGGFVTIKTQVGRGTTFQIYLPAAETGTETNAPSSSPPFIQRGGGELILVVDDEASIRDLITATLARHGYRMLTAADGAEAVALFAPRSTEIRLVITDLNMPHLDGRTLASIVRRINPNTKLLAMSGLGEAGSPGQTRFGGHILQKPFKLDALLSAVNQLLQPTKSP